MKAIVELVVVYTDLPDLIELRVAAASRWFAGETRVYAKPETPALLAAALRGFPADASDAREIEIGTFDPACAGGGARFELRCVDRVGHGILEAKIQTESRTGRVESVNLFAAVEASAVDSFVAELEALQPEVGASARLRAATIHS